MVETRDGLHRRSIQLVKVLNIMEARFSLLEKTVTNIEKEVFRINCLV